MPAGMPANLLVDAACCNQVMDYFGLNMLSPFIWFRCHTVLFIMSIKNKCFRLVSLIKSCSY